MKQNPVHHACVASLIIFHCLLVYVCFNQSEFTLEMTKAYCGAILVGVLLLGGSQTVEDFIKLGQIFVQLKWGNGNVVKTVESSTTTTKVSAPGDNGNIPDGYQPGDLYEGKA